MYDGEMIVVRQLARGHGGRGIMLISGEDEIPDAPLYTVYKKKKAEYRIHVFNGQVIDVQQKRLRKPADDEEITANHQMRNFDNGWVYCREDVLAPDAVLDEAVKAVKVLGLDFGAVDIGWNEHYQTPYVYEVNTAPGLEGTTLEIYLNAFKREYDI